MNENKNIINEEEAAKVSGGVTREEYVAQFRKFGLIDGATPQHNGDTCDTCSRGKLNFLKYQTGRFGDKESIYRCSLCNEYAVYLVEEN